jgi:toxin-antitoxin system PIN domain toxin
VALALDTNVLVYAYRADAPLHQIARSRLQTLATGRAPLGLPWPCAYGFLRIVTHPRVFSPPSPLEDAWGFLSDLRASPVVSLLAETDRHPDVLEALLRAAAPVGNLVHDAHVAALALEHGFDEVLTEDQDFRRFPGIRVVPLR